MKTKQAYKEMAQSEVEKLDPHVEELKAKAEEAQTETRLEYDEQLDALIRIREGVAARLEELDKARDEEREGLWAGMEGALSEFRHAVVNAVHNFR